MKQRLKEYIVFGLLALLSVAPIACHKPLPRDKVVKLMSPKGMCSGEQVKAPSGQSYILSAGHCRKLIDADGFFTVETEDKRILKRKMIAEDAESDLLLIEGLPNLEGLQIAQSIAPGDKVTTLTHGNNFATYKTEGVIIQGERVQIPMSIPSNDEETIACGVMPKQHLDDGYCILDVWEVISTAMVVPGSSGGAVLDKHMELAGVVSAGGEGFGAFVTLSDIQKFIKNY